MKSLTQLQEKLRKILKKGIHLRISVDRKWNDQEFKEVLSIVTDYANGVYGPVVVDDEICEWLDEYKFFLHSNFSK
jgi:hypothetical protein